MLADCFHTRTRDLQMTLTDTQIAVVFRMLAIVHAAIATHQETEDEDEKAGESDRSDLTHG